jgi:hypothetical protein
VAWIDVSFIELTAAGQLRNYTVFPFNPYESKIHMEPKALQMYQYSGAGQIFPYSMAQYLVIMPVKRQTYSPRHAII